MDIFYDLPDLNRIFPAIRLHTAAAVNTEWCKKGNGVKEAMLSVHYPAAFRLQETMASELLRPVRSDCGQQDASVGFVLCQLFNFFQRHHHVLLLFCLSARKRKGRILKIKIPSRTDFIWSEICQGQDRNSDLPYHPRCHLASRNLPLWYGCPVLFSEYQHIPGNWRMPPRRRILGHPAFDCALSGPFNKLRSDGSQPSVSL